MVFGSSSKSGLFTAVFCCLIVRVVRVRKDESMESVKVEGTKDGCWKNKKRTVVRLALLGVYRTATTDSISPQALLI